MIKIRRALISVSNKEGIVDFSSKLEVRKIEIISTGGTYQELINHRLSPTPIEKYTGYPEILGGRVKTLHPSVHAGILGLKNDPKQITEMEKLKILPIDLVVVNLYPFVENYNKQLGLDEMLSYIDIGGQTMIRGAAKNFKNTVVITDSNDYQKFIEELERNNGSISEETSRKLAQKAFSYITMFDSMISSYFNILENEKFPELYNLTYKKKQSLRYGENPHQQAAFYEPVLIKNDFNLLQGKELSFNNVLDFDSALHITGLLFDNTVCIIKHLNPCGVAYSEDLMESFELAKRTDPISTFGGIIGIKGVVEKSLAEKITENFVEGVIAEKFSKDALNVFSKKKNIRLIEINNFKEAMNEIDLRPVHNGMLIQDRDYDTITEKDFKIVTKKKPTDQDIKGLLFAWSVVRFIKSNAIVYTDLNSTLGIGAGQMSRVDSVELGAIKSQKSGLSVVGSYVASDAFFPFRDGIDAIAKVGAKAIIQPGGSVRDEEIIQAADEHGLIMVFTGRRHFRH